MKRVGTHILLLPSIPSEVMRMRRLRGPVVSQGGARHWLTPSQEDSTMACSVSNFVVPLTHPQPGKGHVLSQRLQSFGVVQLSWVRVAGTGVLISLTNANTPIFYFSLGPTNYVARSSLTPSDL